MSESVARWALSGCSSGLAVTVAVALLLLPAQYYVPEPVPPPPQPEPEPRPSWLDRALDFPPVDLFVTFTLLLLGLATYLCEWIQRKVTERRIVKLNRYLSSSVERLRAWDRQQERLASTLRQVQNATSEYNLLLYLLLRQHRCAPHVCPPSNCFFDKGPDEPLLSSIDA